ncbi:AAA family ATPase [Oceanicella actignis]|uniref:Pilus assembly protein CpaE n=1 Tax=Oceanicella actignis TaxID=1189325 RepID=A0A1M7TK12_9RHOB|nr:AAA family ATPase [Oceanicella actignis]SET67661.1 pilus assembly protein CpaE [Oceanicella actignis]SHN71084.1 pilus assembly protein CpaE [Oceanicella actignis]
MQLRRIKSRPVELYAVADNFAVFQAIGDELRGEFPDDSWAPIGYAEMRKLLAAGAPETLEAVLVGVDAADEGRVKEIATLIAAVKAAGLPVILLAKDIGPAAMHALMRAGADDFLPYPTPEGALAETMERLRNRDAAAEMGQGKGRGRRGVVLPVYGVSGGVGSTTFAVNLAWELALETRKANKRVCIMDFDFQYGSVATYLDLPRLESIFELLSEAEAMDHDSLASALTSFQKRLAVLTAPMDALPLDIIGPEDVKKLLSLATHSYDFVVVDMPTTLTHWTETLLHAAERFFVSMEIDMRSAQNMLRFLRTLKAEDLPIEKLDFIMNRAPGFADMSGKARVKRMAESLGIEYSIMLPDGGKTVTQACDHGSPLEIYARSNPLRKEIRRVARTLSESVAAAQAAIA